GEVRRHDWLAHGARTVLGDGSLLCFEWGVLLAKLLAQYVRLRGQRSGLRDGTRLLLGELRKRRLPVRGEGGRLLDQRALLLGHLLERVLPVTAIPPSGATSSDGLALVGGLSTEHDEAPVGDPTGAVVSRYGSSSSHSPSG